MNEIEKMYENAGIKRRCSLWSRVLEMPTTQICEGVCDNEELCSHCIYGPHKNAYYPPFTAEKQLKLLQYLTKLELYAEIVLSSSTDLLSSNNDKYSIRFEISDPGFTLEKVYCKTIEEAIAAIINKLWKHLKKEPKQQIKEILK